MQVEVEIQGRIKSRKDQTTGKLGEMDWISYS